MLPTAHCLLILSLIPVRHSLLSPQEYTKSCNCSGLSALSTVEAMKVNSCLEPAGYCYCITLGHLFSRDLLFYSNKHQEILHNCIIFPSMVLLPGSTTHFTSKAPPSLLVPVGLCVPVVLLCPCSLLQSHESDRGEGQGLCLLLGCGAEIRTIQS